jgi:hypothetical protein
MNKSSHKELIEKKLTILFLITENNSASPVQVLGLGYFDLSSLTQTICINNQSY